MSDQHIVRKITQDYATKDCELVARICAAAQYTDMGVEVVRNLEKGIIISISITKDVPQWELHEYPYGKAE